MKHPTQPYQLQPCVIRIVGHYHTPSILGGVLDTIRLCPQHKFVLSNTDPETVLSAPDNCLVMLRANVHDRSIEPYLDLCDELGKPKVMNVQGGFNPFPLLSRFNLFLVSGYAFAYMRNVIRGVHSLGRSVYVEMYNDTVKLSRMPEQIRCRELPREIETWLEKTESSSI